MSSDARSRLATGWLTMFVIGSDLFVVSPLLPQIAASFAVAAATAGLCVTVFALVYMAGAPLLGHIGDRVGRRRILVCCLGVFAIANLLTAVAGSFAWLLGARLLAGAAAAGVSPSVYALAGGSAPFGRRGTHLAIVVSGLLASLTLATPCAALIGPKIGWPAVFAGIAALGILLAWANLRVWPAPGGSAGVEAPPGRLAIGALAPRLAPTVVWSTALYGTYTYLGTGLGLAGYATGPIAGVILLYGCGAMVGILTRRADNRPFWRKICDHDGAREPQRLLSLAATRAARPGPCRLRLLADVGCGAGVFSRATGRAGEGLSRSANHRAGLEQQRAVPRDLARVADRRTGGRVRRICGGFGGFGGNRDHRLRGQRIGRRLTCLLSQGSRRPTGIARGKAGSRSETDTSFARRCGRARPGPLHKWIGFVNVDGHFARYRGRALARAWLRVRVLHRPVSGAVREPTSWTRASRGSSRRRPEPVFPWIPARPFLGPSNGPTRWSVSTGRWLLPVRCRPF
jgi:MFS family permease